MQDTKPDKMHATPWRQHLGALFYAGLVIGVVISTSPASAASKKHNSQATSSKGKSSTKSKQSPSEETVSERDRRLSRECRGMPNAGACKGFTQR